MVKLQKMFKELRIAIKSKNVVLMQFTSEKIIEECEEFLMDMGNNNVVSEDLRRIIYTSAIIRDYSRSLIGKSLASFNYDRMFDLLERMQTYDQRVKKSLERELGRT